MQRLRSGFAGPSPTSQQRNTQTLCTPLPRLHTYFLSQPSAGTHFSNLEHRAPAIDPTSSRTLVPNSIASHHRVLPSLSLTPTSPPATVERHFLPSPHPHRVDSLGALALASSH